MVNRESRKRLYLWLLDDAGTTMEEGVGGRMEIRDDEARCSEFWMLSRIEDFVDDVLVSEEPAFRLDESGMGRSKLVALPLAKHLNSVLGFFLSPRAESWSSRGEVQYSTRVQLSIECWQQSARRRVYCVVQETASLVENTLSHWFNDLISHIRVKAAEPAFRKALYGREKAAIRSALSAARYIERLRKSDPALQVVALELLHRDVSGEACGRLKQDLRHFLNNSRKKPRLFGACLGHVWILRWNSSKGWHFYVYLFFSGTRQAGVIDAAAVGAYWETVATAGRGRWVPRYFTIRYDAELHQEDRIRATIREVRYVLESDICFRVKPTSGGRCFGRAEEKWSSPNARGRESPNVSKELMSNPLCRR